MNGKYFDLVLCKLEKDAENRLFYAPAFSWLQKGDVVIAETTEWNQTAEVVAVLTLGKDDSKTLDFIMGATGLNAVMGRIKSKLSYVELSYDDTEKPKEVVTNEQFEF